MNIIIYEGSIHFSILTALNDALHLLPDVVEQVPCVTGLIDQGP